MVVIAKIFQTYVFSRNLGLYLGKVHYSMRNFFFWGIIISLKRRSLSCLREQLKPFFPWGTVMSLGKKILSCHREEFKLFFLVLME